MPDTVTSQIYDGERNVIVHLNSVSDGTGQTGDVILDPSTLNPPGSLRLWRCTYDIKGGGVNIFWDAPTPRSMVGLAGTSIKDFSRFGGLRNDAVDATGLIKITTNGFVADSGYAITLEFRKGALPSNPVLFGAVPELPVVEPPVIVDAPLLYGVGEPEGQVGFVLTCTMGNWVGEPTSYEYQFKSDGVDVEATGIGDTYVPNTNDVGHEITCLVTATNAAGSTEAPLSNAVMVIGTTTTTSTTGAKN